MLAQEPRNSHALRRRVGILSELDPPKEPVEAYARSFGSGGSTAR